METVRKLGAQSLFRRGGQKWPQIRPTLEESVVGVGGGGGGGGLGLKKLCTTNGPKK